jgi:hypothetical protein
MPLIRTIPLALYNQVKYATAGTTFSLTKEDPLEPIEAFMKRKCTPELSNIMDISNLFAIIELREQLSDSEQNRLNDYNRFCRAWLNPGTRQQIKANIKRWFVSETGKPTDANSDLKQ